MVHASLRKIGPIEGGAIDLIDATLDVMGDATPLHRR
jgi:aminoglycoside N3'-acetyltransferase